MRYDIYIYIVRRQRITKEETGENKITNKGNKNTRIKLMFFLCMP